MSELDRILKMIESRPGAENRIRANVARMNKVLGLRKPRNCKLLTQTVLGRCLGPVQRRVPAFKNAGAPTAYHRRTLH